MALLTGKVCIVTGAGQGLGRAIALELSGEGATPVLLERNADALESVAQEIARRGGTCSRHRLDVTDYQAYSLAVSEAHAMHGRIDVLVNNAGINPAPKSILDDTLEEWRHTIGVNLEAVYMGSKLVAPIMAAQNSGRIIHISSIQGFASSGLCGAYNAAKGALIAYTKSMAVELAPYNILVNAVAPGCRVQSAGGRLRHRRVPRVQLLPVHDGAAAGRGWWVDEYVLKTRQTGKREEGT